jgi:hypothetical protein
VAQLDRNRARRQGLIQSPKQQEASYHMHFYKHLNCGILARTATMTKFPFLNKY